MTDPIKVSNTIDGQKTLQFFEESIISHIRDMDILETLIESFFVEVGKQGPRRS